MAITLADFTKIWASTSPLTPYSFSDANYQQGWNFVGSAPPARQMWDSIQKQNDEKLKYIVDNFLPSSGGTMTGAIVGNPLTLTADDGNDSADLVLDPSGSATWNGKELERINAQGTNYIRYENGIQICWGKTSDLSSTNADVDTDITLPVAFKDSDYCVSLMSYWLSGGWNNHTIMVSYKTTTSMKAYLRNLNNTAYNFYFMWIAIGYWK